MFLHVSTTKLHAEALDIQHELAIIDWFIKSNCNSELRDGNIEFDDIPRAIDSFCRSQSFLWTAFPKLYLLTITNVN